MDWNKPILGVPLKYALPIGGGVTILAGLVFWYYRSKSSSNSNANAGTASATPGTANSVASGSGGLMPYVPNDGSTAGPQSTAVPTPVWQYGQPPSNPQDFVWVATGQNGPNGISTTQVMPGTAGTPASNPGSFPGFGAYSWQWAPVPQGWSVMNYAQALSAALASGGLFTSGGETGTLSGYPGAGYSPPANPFVTA